MAVAQADPGSDPAGGARFFCTAGRGLEPFLMREVRARLEATQVSRAHRARGEPRSPRVPSWHQRGAQAREGLVSTPSLACSGPHPGPLMTAESNRLLWWFRSLSSMVTVYLSQPKF